MTVAEQQGDLFDAPEAAYAHGCNCAGAMGKGIAVEFKNRWPDMYARYRELCEKRLFDVGDVFVWQADDRLILNLGTQRTWRTKATADGVRRALEEMVRQARQRDVEAIAMPRIAAGLGGLHWNDVRALLDEIVPDDLTVTVYTPPPDP